MHVVTGIFLPNYPDTTSLLFHLNIHVDSQLKSTSSINLPINYRPRLIEIWRFLALPSQHWTLHRTCFYHNFLTAVHTLSGPAKFYPCWFQLVSDNTTAAQSRFHFSCLVDFTQIVSKTSSCWNKSITSRAEICTQEDYEETCSSCL